MRHRICSAILAFALLICPMMESRAASAPTLTSSVAPQPEAAPRSWWSPPPELMAQGAGALAGFAVFSLFVVPQATAVGGVASILAGRVMATALAAAGAVAGTVVYDIASEQPIDYAYFWHRGGFVVGVATGIAAFGVLGYPGGTGTSWLGWVANRSALLGTGLVGAWAIDNWHQQSRAERP